MTTEQEQHMESIAHRFNKDFIEKYAKGAAEHKGLLSDAPIEQLAQFAKEEVLDQASYIYTLIDKVKECLDYCESTYGHRVCKNCGLGE